MWKWVLTWIPMILIAIANGALRELWYGKHFSELRAHQISTLTGILLFGGYIWPAIGILQPDSGGQAIAIGLVWLGLTVSFEFLFGHYVGRKSWDGLLHDYNLLAGRVWLLLLLWITIAPYVFYRFRE
jgi:hypothetical protein